MNELLASASQGLQRYVRGIVRDEHLAWDVLQEVFLLVVRKLRWLRDPELFEPWCRRVASRVAFRALERARGRREVDLDEVRTEPGEHPEPPAAEVTEHLEALLRHVPARCRAVLWLHYQDGLALEGVAAVLEVPLGTVKSRLAYGLAHLRELLAPPPPDEAVSRAPRRTP